MKRNRSSKSGQFVSKAEAKANPETTVSETVTDNSALTLLADHVREMLQANYLPAGGYWETIFRADLERIDQRK